MRSNNYKNAVHRLGFMLRKYSSANDVFGYDHFEIRDDLSFDMVFE